MNIILAVLAISALILAILSSLNKAPLWVAVVLLAIANGLVALQRFAP